MVLPLRIAFIHSVGERAQHQLHHDFTTPETPKKLANNARNGTWESHRAQPPSKLSTQRDTTLLCVLIQTMNVRRSTACNVLLLRIAVGRFRLSSIVVDRNLIENDGSAFHWHNARRLHAPLGS